MEEKSLKLRGFDFQFYPLPPIYGAKPRKSLKEDAMKYDIKFISY